MIAEEWQQSVNPDAMLWALLQVPDRFIETFPSGGPDAAQRRLATLVSKRKLRLFGAACCRRLRQRLPENAHGLELIERLADGQLRGTEHPLDAWQTPVAAYVAYGLNTENIGMAAANVARAAPDWNAERLAQCDLLRDLFDPLFWDLPFNPSWVNPLVRSMAQAIYDEHRFEDLPILADALEETGCGDAIVLEHCRSSRPHARGCWLVDALLSRNSGSVSLPLIDAGV